MSRISYSAVVLTEESRDRLVRFAKLIFGVELSRLDLIADHMTICMGPLPSKLVHMKGSRVRLVVDGYGGDRMVKAVRVTGVPSHNKTAHVTVAVNRSAGAKPVMSNQIRDWYPVHKFVLDGVIREVEMVSKQPGV